MAAIREMQELCLWLGNDIDANERLFTEALAAGVDPGDLIAAIDAARENLYQTERRLASLSRHHASKLVEQWERVTMEEDAGA